MKQLFILFSVFLLLFLGCKRDTTSCGETKTVYNYISAESLNQTPYFNNPAFDTISFASDKGDTLIFVKTKTDSSWYCETESVNPDCPPPYICYQIIKNIYKTTSGIGTFEIVHSNRSFNSKTENINIYINSNYYSVYIKWLSPSFGYKPFFADTIIGKFNYKNAIQVFNLNGSTNESNLLLNKDFGVFCFFDYESSSYFTLIRK